MRQNVHINLKERFRRTERTLRQSRGFVSDITIPPVADDATRFARAESGAIQGGFRRRDGLFLSCSNKKKKKEKKKEKERKRRRFSWF